MSEQGRTLLRARCLTGGAIMLAALLAGFALARGPLRGAFERGEASADPGTADSPGFSAAPPLAPTSPPPPPGFTPVPTPFSPDPDIEPQFEGVLAGIRLIADPQSHPPDAIECEGTLTYEPDELGATPGTPLAIFDDGLPAGVEFWSGPGTSGQTTCDGRPIASGATVVVNGESGVVIQKVIRPEPWASSHEPAHRTSQAEIFGHAVVFARGQYDDVQRGDGRILWVDRVEEGWLVVELIASGGATFSDIEFLAGELLK